MMDISDGLALDARRMAAASEVTIALDGAALGDDPERAMAGERTTRSSPRSPTACCLRGSGSSGRFSIAAKKDCSATIARSTSADGIPTGTGTRSAADRAVRRSRRSRPVPPTTAWCLRRTSPEQFQAGRSEVRRRGATCSFDDDHGIGRKKRRECDEIGRHRGVIEIVRRIREDEVERTARPLEEGLDRALVDPTARHAAGFRDDRGVAPDDGSGLASSLDELGTRGPSAEGLQTERSRSRVQIEDPCAGDGAEGLEGAEERFAYPIARRTCSGARHLESGTSGAACDDPRHLITIRQPG